MVYSYEAPYIRANRLVNEPIRLNGQVSACVQVLNLGWFPDEEKVVSEFLKPEKLQIFTSREIHNRQSIMS